MTATFTPSDRLTPANTAANPPLPRRSLIQYSSSAVLSTLPRVVLCAPVSEAAALSVWCCAAVAWPLLSGASCSSDRSVVLLSSFVLWARAIAYDRSFSVPPESARILDGVFQELTVEAQRSREIGRRRNERAEQCCSRQVRSNGRGTVCERLSDGLLGH